MRVWIVEVSREGVTTDIALFPGSCRGEEESIPPPQEPGNEATTDSDNDNTRLGCSVVQSLNNDSRQGKTINTQSLTHCSKL